MLDNIFEQLKAGPSHEEKYRAYGTLAMAFAICELASSIRISSAKISKAIENKSILGMQTVTEMMREIASLKETL